MDVSVIITTKNEEEHIGSCLSSVTGQDYPQDKIELILVDNNSTDRTLEIASRYGCRIYTSGPERSAQRNLGAEKSSGEFIIFLDADMSISLGLLAECVRAAREKGAGAIYIPERVVGKGFWIRVRDFERSFYNATVIDCVRFMRKDLFLSVGGFDSSLTGPEDWDLDRRVRKAAKTAITENVLYHNEGTFALKKYIAKKIYYCNSFKGYANKWGRRDPQVRKQLGAFYRYFGVFVENGKWIRLVRHPILCCGMYFLRCSLGFAYLFNKYNICVKN